MRFQTNPVNRSTRALAALVLLGFGVTILVSAPTPASFIGAILSAVAAGILGKESWKTVRHKINRRDRYDLSLLKNGTAYHGPSRDDPTGRPDQPAWESEAGDAAYCRRCDVSMPSSYSICPRCGTHLGL